MYKCIEPHQLIMNSINDFLPRPRQAVKSNVSVAVATAGALKHAENQVAVPAANKLAIIHPQNGLARPSKEVVDETRDRTQAALDAILENKLGTKTKEKSGPSIVKYTPASQVNVSARERTLKIVDVQYDPFEPARHKHVKAPARPLSPPAPVLKAAPPKLTAEEQRQWYIPPSVSGWKNNKGFVIDVEKRVAADGRFHESAVEAGDRQAKLAEALYEAETKAREEVNQRHEAAEQKQLKANEEKERRLKLLAQKARKRPLDDDEKERERKRASRLKAATKERDITEAVALGHKPTLTGDAQFDSRLFGKSSGTKGLYDEPLFAAEQAAREIYRPKLDEASGGPVEFERIEDKYE